jgi:hypothetical protein
VTMLGWLKRLWHTHTWEFVDSVYSPGYDCGPQDYAFPSCTVSFRCIACGDTKTEQHSANPLLIDARQAEQDCKSARRHYCKHLWVSQGVVGEVSFQGHIIPDPHGDTLYRCEKCGAEEERYP